MQSLAQLHAQPLLLRRSPRRPAASLPRADSGDDTESFVCSDNEERMVGIGALHLGRVSDEEKEDDTN